jgi:Uma2 family endonuclease
MAVRAGKPKRSLIAPTEDEWHAMSPDDRMRLLVDINEALSDPPIAMSEGRQHKKAKNAVLDELGLHYSSIGRAIYLAEEMAVLYPGQESFSPDILVVMDVPQPEDDERLAWVVVEEGKGLDLVIEVLHRGDRHKDLVASVERYAQLSIPEYFVYDRLEQQIHGYRLPQPTATRYERIGPQFGHYTSIVLGLDLAVVVGKLQRWLLLAATAGTVEEILSA